MASDSPSAKAYSADPALYIYTSLTAGSSHIVTATSRLETILRANKIPFKAIDIATDEKARMLWGRRAGKDEGGRARKLPALIQMGLVLGDLPEIEEWNEYGEMKMHVTIYYDDYTQPPISQAPKNAGVSKAAPAAAKETGVTSTTASEQAAAASTAAGSAAPVPAAPPLPDTKKENQTPVAAGQSRQSVLGSAVSTMAQVTLPIRSIAEEAAQKAKQVHLQALRDKVYGKGGGETGKDAEKKNEESGKDDAKADKPSEAAPQIKIEDRDAEVAKDAENATLPLAGAGISGVTPSKSTISLVSDDSSPPPPNKATSSTAGLQSPTTGTWKGGQTPTMSTEEVLRTLQSPTSGTWHSPTDGEPSIRSLHGSIVASASQEEIAALEKSQAIQEEPDEEEREDEEDREKEAGHVSAQQKVPMASVAAGQPETTKAETGEEG
jgi:hypothetical protein